MLLTLFLDCKKKSCFLSFFWNWNYSIHLFWAICSVANPWNSWESVAKYSFKKITCQRPVNHRERFLVKKKNEYFIDQRPPRDSPPAKYFFEKMNVLQTPRPPRQNISLKIWMYHKPATPTSKINVIQPRTVILPRKFLLVTL